MTARLSWVAYIQYFVIGILLYLFVVSSSFAVISGLLGLALGKSAAQTVLYGLTLLYLAGFGWVLFKLTRCRAYIDETGVWYYSGLFPWSEGIRGVRWENFDQAQYQQSVFGWATHSYTIYLLDRYGRSVTIKNLHNGRDWSAGVNDYAFDYIR